MILDVIGHLDAAERILIAASILVPAVHEAYYRRLRYRAGLPEGLLDRMTAGFAALSYPERKTVPALPLQ